MKKTILTVLIVAICVAVIIQVAGHVVGARP